MPTTPYDLPGSEFQLEARLVEVGEPVTFTLRDVTGDDRLEVFPRYLERCDPERATQSPTPLQWLDDLAPEILTPAEAVRYVPSEPGNYLARWTSESHGVLYRYFAAIDQTYLIYRPIVWNHPVPFPATGGAELHNGGLPFDWLLPFEEVDEAYLPRLLQEQQLHGSGMVHGMAAAATSAPDPALADTLRDSVAEFRRHGLDVGRVANLWPGTRLDTAKAQTACAAGFDVIDGYVPRADICGMGAPYFPFYIGPVDYRFPSQEGPTEAVSCVFDFVGSWHFHGPVSFHRPSANGSWERARHYIDLAAREAVLTARNSGVHNFISTLVNFESPVAWDATNYGILWDDERGREFLEQYLDLLAFDHARRWPIVFARAADYADYFRAHYAQMPRRVVSSITHDIEYDRWWTDEWHEQRLMPSGYVPMDQSLRAFRQARAMPQYNMPVSCEFINYNDNRRTCRFEYACPKPVHYYDLTGERPWPTRPEEVDVPDPRIEVSTLRRDDSYRVVYGLSAGAVFADYLLAIWDIPRECRDWHLETNAKELIWIENTDGNCRGIVRFDLEPRCKVELQWRR